MAPEQASGRREAAHDGRGHLQPRSDPLRAAHGPAAVPGADDPRSPREGEVGRARAAALPAAGSGSATLATVALRCLEKDPKRRYASAAALAEDTRALARRRADPRAAGDARRARAAVGAPPARGHGAPRAPRRERGPRIRRRDVGVAHRGEGAPGGGQADRRDRPHALRDGHAARPRSVGGRATWPHARPPLAAPARAGRGGPARLRVALPRPARSRRPHLRGDRGPRGRLLLRWADARRRGRARSRRAARSAERRAPAPSRCPTSSRVIAS